MSTTRTTPTTALNAHHKSVYDHSTKEYTYHSDVPEGIDFHSIFETEEAAAEFVAKFPKYVKLHITALVTRDGEHLPMVRFGAVLDSDGVNGGKNETGVKRYNKLVSVLDNLGTDVEWTTPFGNSYESREAFETAIA